MSPLAILAVIGPLVFWAGVLVVVMASLFCAVFALRNPQRGLVYISAIALAVALVAVSVPGPAAPPIARVLIGLAVLALSVVGGAPASQLALALATRGSVAPGLHGGIVVAHHVADGEDTTREVLRGGLSIGFLERFATTAVIMAGFPQAIAVIVAIKGVGRFSELEASEARERFIIGTLVSLIWACACAAVFHFTAR